MKHSSLSRISSPRIISTIFLFIPASALLQDFVGALAAKYGWIQSAVTIVEPTMAYLALMTHTFWFWPLSYILMGVVGTLWAVYFFPQKTKWDKEDVILDLSLSASGVATGKKYHNIQQWHMLPIGVIAMVDAQGKELLRTQSCCVLFLIYINPVAVRQFHVELEGRAPPHFEVKDNNPYGCVIVLTEDVSGCLLKVRIEV
ncbi:MAG: hypothetical protein POG74_02570 [Acidocella sp.]|nr:hypothetical protein [Acidocella sp.]